MAEENNNDTATENSSALQQKYGFDITYDPQDNTFVLHQEGKDDIPLSVEDIEYNRWQKNYADDLKETFTNKTEYLSHETDLYKEIQKDNPNLSFMTYAQFANAIVVNKFVLKEEDREKCKQLLVEKGLTDEKAENFISLATDNNLNKSLSSWEHELSHREDHKKFDNYKYDLPPQYMAKLNMMSEVKANMTQAGLALDMYQATGSLKGFDDILPLADEMQSVKKTLTENPNMTPEEQKALVAGAVHDGWMKKYNSGENYGYIQQAYMISYLHDYPLWSLEDNAQAQQTYEQRVDAMFRDIQGLGDVRQYVNPNFKLYPELEEALQPDINRNLRAVMIKDAKNAGEYSQNLMNYLNMVKEIDADGVRTPQEQKQLDKYVKNAQKQAAKQDSLSPLQIAQMSGRVR